MTSANTEYSAALPLGIRAFRIHLRDWSAFQLAYVAGKVATPTEPYQSVPANGEKYEDWLETRQLNEQITLYFASSVAAKTAEIEVWF